MFAYCNSLSSIPDISKWNLNNAIKNNDNNENLYLPKIDIKNNNNILELDIINNYHYIKKNSLQIKFDSNSLEDIIISPLNSSEIKNDLSDIVLKENNQDSNKEATNNHPYNDLFSNEIENIDENIDNFYEKFL